MIPPEYIFYVSIGAIAGFSAGLFGIGGGMVIVPALLYLFEQMQTVSTLQAMSLAVGTSLAIMIFTALTAVITHLKQANIHWHIYHRLWPGIVIGTIIGAILAPFLPILILKKILGIMLLWVFINMIRRVQAENCVRKISKIIQYLAGLSIGTLSGLVGIGGGALIIPYLSYQGVDTRKISAVSSMCTLTVALIGTITYLLTGLSAQGLPKDCVGYIYWPAVLWITIPSMIAAPFGAYLTYILPVQQLKYAFAVLLLLISVKLLI